MFMLNYDNILKITWMQFFTIRCHSLPFVAIRCHSSPFVRHSLKVDTIFLNILFMFSYTFFSAGIFMHTHDNIKNIYIYSYRWAWTNPFGVSAEYWTRTDPAKKASRSDFDLLLKHWSRDIENFWPCISPSWYSPPSAVPAQKISNSKKVCVTTNDLHCAVEIFIREGASDSIKSWNQSDRSDNSTPHRTS